MFKKILIANRGEIAVRVIRACRELGVKTVAIYSDVDRDALHVRFADEAYPCGPPPSRESYLVMDRVIEIAKRAGAEAIHPGYGFLAENGAFSDRCRDEGIVFIGPSGDVMRAMGDKVTARQTMQKAGVPIVPGTTERLSDEEIARWIQRDRPARHDQGERRRRRQGHAPGAQRGRDRAGDRARARRGALVLRRRRALRREVRRAAAPHRDPGAGGPARQRRAPVRARVLDPAPPPEGDRGGAGQRHLARAARADGRGGGRGGARGELPGRRHLRVPGRPPRSLLLPRDEHARAGRARHHRGDHRRRHREGDDPRGLGRAARHRAERPRDHGARDRGAHLRRGSRPELRALARRPEGLPAGRRNRRARRRRRLPGRHRHRALRPDGGEARGLGRRPHGGDRPPAPRAGRVRREGHQDLDPLPPEGGAPSGLHRRALRHQLHRHAHGAAARAGARTRAKRRRRRGAWR